MVSNLMVDQNYIGSTSLRRGNSMDKTNAEQAMQELTLILLYLSKFTDHDIPTFDGKPVYHAWKGYDFGILNELDDKDYIRQGGHPSRSKSVYITESGQEKARELLTKYGIEDFESS